MGKRAALEMANFSVNLDRRLLKKIEELAKRENRSRNNMIHQMLEFSARHYREERVWRSI